MRNVYFCCERLNFFFCFSISNCFDWKFICWSCAELNAFLIEIWLNNFHCPFRFARFQELIAEQSGVRMSDQQLLFENHELEKIVKALQPLSSYPHTSTQNPIYLFSIVHDLASMSVTCCIRKWLLPNTYLMSLNWWSKTLNSTYRLTALWLELQSGIGSRTCVCKCGQ